MRVKFAWLAEWSRRMDAAELLWRQIICCQLAVDPRALTIARQKCYSSRCPNERVSTFKRSLP